MNRVVLLTGLAGAGRTTASDALEDMGFYVMENIPSSMIKNVVEGIKETRQEDINLAIAVDLRDATSIELLFKIRGDLRDFGDNVHLVFLDADEDTIVRRFEQTRRPHPYARSGALTRAIAFERQLLGDVLAEADIHIDTTTTNPTQLSQQLNTFFSGEGRGTTVFVNSFGYKYGAPRDADFIFDVRFLPNPYWDSNLKDLSGLDPVIQEYVKKFDKYESYIDAVIQSLSISIDEFTELGKGFITIGIGCTGGFHRSVTVTTDITKRLRDIGYKVVVVHRELEVSDSE